jgi:GH24 family phage-related lysozyme (muramidase)
MTRRLLDCIRHTDLQLSHHRAFWEAVEAKLPPGSLANDGELGSIWLAAVPPKESLWLQPALKLIQEVEGCKLQSYKCPAGIWTIGWGSTAVNGKPVGPGDSISQTRADGLLAEQVTAAARDLFRLIPEAKTFRPEQQAALVSWLYNVGAGAVADSTLRKRLAAGEDPVTVARAELPRWNKANGKELPGLTRRRAAEVALFAGVKLQQEPPPPPPPPVKTEQQPGKLRPTDPFTARISAHITLGEFALNQEARRFKHQYQVNTAAELAAFMERARANFGGKPVIITSGYRPPAVNKAVGGATNSEHLYNAPDVGAVDFYIDGVSVKSVQDWCDKNWPYSLGYGAPRGFVHLGIRAGRPRVRWDY